MENIKITKRISEGGNGKVLQADLLGDRKRKFAMKIIPLENRQVEENFAKEISIMEKLNSRDIVNLEDHYIVEKMDEKLGVLVLDRMQTDLMEYLQKNSFTLVEIQRTFRKMCKIVHRCHKRGIFHLDLKPENFLVNYETESGIKSIKLCDFGSSYDFNSSSIFPSRFGTVYYKAPEILFKKEEEEEEEFNINPEKLDVWSLGVILYIMFNGVYPFLVERNSLHCRGLREIKQVAGDNAFHLLSSIFQTEVKRRPTIKKILKHPFFTENFSGKTDLKFPCRDFGKLQNAL